MEHYVNLAIKAIFIENLALSFFLGMCTFLAISRKVSTAIGLGAAVIVVQGVTVPLNALIYHNLLKPGALAWAGLSAIDLSFLGLITYIGVIAASVQVLEMFLDRYAPALYNALGIFLPLITVNCTVLFISLKVTTVDGLSYIQTVVYSVSAAVGFWLAMIIVAAINEKLDLIGRVPKGLQGPGIIMVITGIIALAFMGFSGMV